jgi:hypothetical protein
MWRAWGIALLVLSQDLAVPVTFDDHEFSFRPPAGWSARPARAPSIAKFFRTSPDGKSDADVLVTHILTSNPTPLAGWQEQAKENFKTNYPEGKILEDKLLEVNGRPAHLLSWTDKGVQRFKLGIFRTNLEYYAVDASYPDADAAKIRPLLDASAASLRIHPAPMKAEERLAHAKALQVMKRAKLDPALKGERWYLVQLGVRKMGHQRVKVDESEGLVTFEADTVLDVGDGNRDVSSVRGSFSPDARVQKVESEQVKQDKKEKWTFRASVTLDAGKVRARREMNGAVEEKSFAVDEGVLLADVVDIYRSFFAEEGKGAYFIRTLSAFADETNTELLEVAEPEKLRLDGVDQKLIMVMSTIDRRKTLTNAYGLDRRLQRMGGANDPLVLKAVTREEAVGK